jgi:hypothetical protein
MEIIEMALEMSKESVMSDDTPWIVQHSILTSFPFLSGFPD